VTISIRSMAFSPAQAEVAAGGTVTWKNEDLVEEDRTGRVMEPCRGEARIVSLRV
jgi:plastocyanin